MKVKTFLMLLIITPVILSCTKIYNADINTDRKVPVINGFLSNTAGNNYVILSLAIPYDSVGTGQRIGNAHVYVKDNTDSLFKYTETLHGYYIPVNPSFAGVVNKTYTLTVETPDGQVYVSKPEKMMPLLTPLKVYGGYNTEEQLVEDYFGNFNKTVTDVCEIYYDFASDNGDIPRFRFTSSQLIEYIISKALVPPEDSKAEVEFYCWMMQNDNTLRFTNEKYQSSSTEVKKQTVCVTTPNGKINVPDMSLKTKNYSDTIILTYEFNRILRINQFRLNDDAYSYYKGIESQSSAEGKMFDPLTTQLEGNMICKSDSTRLVLGLFEVSSVSTHSWAVRRNGTGTPIVIKSVPNIIFPSDGFKVDTIPDFWIY